MKAALVRALCLLCLVAGFVSWRAPTSVEAAVPPEFESPVTMVSIAGFSPTNVIFTPDNSHMFTTSKTGELYVFPVVNGNPVVPPAPPPPAPFPSALDLSGRVCSETERGLLGVAADPGFATNRHFYLYYTWDRGVTGPSRCELRFDQPVTANTPINRVSRFTLAADNTVDPASERVIVDNIPSPGGHHNGGNLQFGNDGMLYISIGDGGCEVGGGANTCDNGNTASRDQNILVGKILRIIPDPDLTPAERIPRGEGENGNPFAATGVICGVNGQAPAGTPSTTPCQETYAWGLRNPFRIAFDPNVTAPASRMFINDVGSDVWEEINKGEAGADYRWNTCEGLYVIDSSTQPCPPPQGKERDPIHTYQHIPAEGCYSITGGAFVPPGVWPARFNGKYLFADYVCGKIFMIDAANPSLDTREEFADELDWIVDMTFGPSPNGTALYVAQINNSAIYRIMLTNGSNHSPTAVLNADPLYGSREVTFNAAGSSDLDGDTLEYLWNFGNGVTDTTTAPTVTYTYPADGRYIATLQVRDSQGAISLNTATVRIDTTNTPPQVTITSPLAGATFAVGEVITLEATATDAEDGPLPPSALRWEVVRHHRAGQPGAHTHPWFGPQEGNSLTFTTPPPEDLDAAHNSYIEIRVTATDSDEGSTTVTRDLLPNKVNITFEAQPAGVYFIVNGVHVTTPQTIVSWEGYQLEVIAPSQNAPDGQLVNFESWADGTIGAQRTIITTGTPATYSATFLAGNVEEYLPLVVVP